MLARFGLLDWKNRKNLFEFVRVFYDCLTGKNTYKLIVENNRLLLKI